MSDPTEEEIDQHKYLVRDVTDVQIPLGAINARVDCLVSENKDLTSQDKSTEEMRIHLKVLISGTFLRDVMGWTSDRLEEVRGRTLKDLQVEVNVVL